MRCSSALASLCAFFVVAVLVAVVAWPSSAKPAQTGTAAPQIRLAVLVVFDQMRGDYPERWRALFGPNGFKRLQRDGAWFVNCHYPYGTTTTGPGHASMLTGACPDTHGIVNNEWSENGRSVYCAGEERYQLVPSAPKFPLEKGEKEPAPPKWAGSPGRLKSETVADVLKATHGAKSKVFGLSLKDRSAILPTGRRPDGAYWFYNGVFGTSTYYTDSVSPWVAEFNKSRFADRWYGKDWTAFRPELNYLAWSGGDNESGEGSGDGQGREFPHPTTGGKPKLGPKYYSAMERTPYGNELLWELAKKCIVAEKLGTDDVPDLLVVSFSSNDLGGHVWGPDSQEVLDFTLHSDALMAQLLAFLDEHVGRDRYLLGLTADHGICPLPEVSRKNGTAPTAARVGTSELQKSIDAHLTTKFPLMKTAEEQAIWDYYAKLAHMKTADKKDSRWVDSIQFPWIHLNTKLIAASGQPREAIVAEVVAFLRNHPKVYRTFTQAELAGDFPASDLVATRVKRSYHPGRCGDVYVVLPPYSLPAGEGSTGTTHGAPFNYDTHVPLMVYGPGVRAGTHHEATTPQAMASIFAKWLKVRRPRDAAFPVPASLE